MSNLLLANICCFQWKMNLYSISQLFVWSHLSLRFSKLMVFHPWSWMKSWIITNELFMRYCKTCGIVTSNMAWKFMGHDIDYGWRSISCQPMTISPRMFYIFKSKLCWLRIHQVNEFEVTQGNRQLLFCGLSGWPPLITIDDHGLLIEKIDYHRFSIDDNRWYLHVSNKQSNCSLPLH